MTTLGPKKGMTGTVTSRHIFLPTHSFACVATMARFATGRAQISAASGPASPHRASVTAAPDATSPPGAPPIFLVMALSRMTPGMRSRTTPLTAEQPPEGGGGEAGGGTGGAWGVGLGVGFFAGVVSGLVGGAGMGSGVGLGAGFFTRVVSGLDGVVPWLAVTILL
jgi:hypothetical protein